MEKQKDLAEDNKLSNTKKKYKMVNFNGQDKKNCQVTPQKVIPSLSIMC